MKEHEAVCLTKSKALYENCGSPRTTVLQTPMSWLHKVDDPFVAIWANPVYRKGGCEIQIRQEIQDIISELVRETPNVKNSKDWTSFEVIFCKVYGKTEAIIKYGRYRVVRYCGKKHQKADWGVHKKIYIPKSRLNN